MEGRAGEERSGFRDGVGKVKGSLAAAWGGSRNSRGSAWWEGGGWYVE